MRDRHDLPDAFEVIRELHAEAGLGGPEICLFLDFDGTLAPIVERPEEAVLDPAMRRRLKAVAARFRTAVISGRGLDDLVARVGIEDIFYAASHGFELRHPSGEVIASEAAIRAADRTDELEQLLLAALVGITGTQLERKRFGVAVHYRRADPEAGRLIEQVVRRTAKAFPELTLKPGKKVLELVPDLDWDKGKAVTYILEAAGLGPGNAYPIVIGDDLTDEDAFRAIEDWGCGIAVGLDGPRRTLAWFRLDDVEAVGRFLEALVD